MEDILHKTRCIGLTEEGEIPSEVLDSSEPVILRQLVGRWPLVLAAKSSDCDVIDYLKSFYNGLTTIISKIDPEREGQLHYNENLTKLDYTSYKGRIDEALDSIYEGIHDSAAPGYYIASNIIDTHFPDMLERNTLSIPRIKDPKTAKETVSIWVGNRTTATCHYDALDNVACCVAGRRRFTLFPPSQVANLYPGPLAPTPGGQVISLVDFRDPDFEEFPRFRDALSVAQVADLEPGDALFLPSMWWHHVEALAPFNLLVNYWWNDAPRHMTSGMNALYTAMLGIRDKPKHERDGWKELFDYYIFSGAENASEKIPPEARGFLGSLDDMSARKLRALIINKLNR